MGRDLGRLESGFAACAGLQLFQRGGQAAEQFLFDGEHRFDFTGRLRPTRHPAHSDGP